MAEQLKRSRCARGMVALAASAALAGIYGSDAKAQYVWTPADANWNVADLNWNDGTQKAWADGNEAVFDGTGLAFPTPTINAGNVSASKLTFNATGYTVAGTTANDTLTLNAAVPPPVIAVTTAGHVATISANLLGTQGFHKDGLGTLVLTGANGGATGLSGVIQINAGVLRGVSTTATSSVLGKGSVNLAGGDLELVADANTLYTDGTTAVPPAIPPQTAISLTASGKITLDRLAAGAGVTHTVGSLTIGGGSVLTVAPGANVSSGTAGLTFRGVTVGTGGGTITTNANALTVLGSGAQDIALGANQLTIDGAGDLNIIDNTTGTGAFVKNGAGTVTITTDPNHTGLTTVNAGVLVLNHGGSTDFNAVINDGGTLRVAGGDNRLGDNNSVDVKAGGTLELQGTDAIRNLTGDGTVVANVANRTLTLAQTNNATFTWGGSLSNGTHVLNVNKNGTGVVTFTGNNTYTGTTNITNGRLDLTGGGRMSGVTQVALTTTNAKLSVGLPTDTAFNADRLNDANTQIELQDGSEVIFNGATDLANTTVETLKEFETNSGHNTVTLLPAAGGQVQVTTTVGLIRSNKGTFNFRGTGLGGTGADSSRIILTTPPTLVGGAGAAGTTNISIIPFATGSTTAAGVGDSLVTYGATGIRPLAIGEYAAGITDGTLGADNVRLTSGVNLTYGAAINSLNLQSGGSLTNGSGRQLGLSSGVILAGGGSVAGGSIEAGASEIFLLGGGAGTTTVNSGLRSTGGLTIGTGDNAGLVALGSAGAVTGEININRGVLRLDVDGAINPFARNNLRFAREGNNAGAVLRLNGNTQHFGVILAQSQGTIENGHPTNPATFHTFHQGASIDRDVGMILNNGGAASLGITKSGAQRISFVNDGNLSGVATIQAGKLELKSGADWDSLGGMVLDGGTFALYNTSSSNANTDRLPDLMDVTFRGGNFLSDHDDNSGTSYSERVGAMVVESGVSLVDIDYHSNSGRTAVLIFHETSAADSITRSPGAIMRFNTQSGSGGSLGVDGRGRIQIGPNNADPNPTLLKNGILHEGGIAFAVVGDSFPTISGDLVTGGGSHDTSVTALTVYQTGADASLWSAADNARPASAATFTGATTVNSLILNDGVDLDLGGNTLTVDSGGILAITTTAAGPNKTISNGSITGGAFAGSELVVRAGDDVNTATAGNVVLSANVIDNGGNATSFTKWGGKSLTLSGNNTFSGHLNVTQGTLIADGVGRLGAGAARTLRLANATLDLSTSTASETLPFAAIVATTINEGVIQGAEGQTLSFAGTLSGLGSLRFNNTVNATITAPVDLSGGLAVGSGAASLAAALPTSDFTLASGANVVGGSLQVGLNQRSATLTLAGGSLQVGDEQFGSELNIGFRSINSDSPAATTTVTKGLVDLSGASNFEAHVSVVRLGVITGSGGNAQAEGDLILGVNSSITAGSILQGDSSASGNTTASPSSIAFGSGLNTVRTTNWTVGGRKGVGAVTIAAGGTLNIADFTGGPTNLFIGDNGDIDTGTVASGTFDTTGGTLIARLNNLDIGDKNRTSSNGGNGGGNGTMTIAAGANDVSAANVVIGRLTRGTGTPNANSRGDGTLNFGGGTFEVLNDIQMGIWAAGTESDGTAIGRLNISGGDFSIGGNITKSDSDRSAALINLTGGTLDLQIQAGNDTTPGNISASQLTYRGGSIVDAGTITLDGRGVTSGTAFAPLDNALILRDVTLAAPVALTQATASKGGILYEAAGGGAGATLSTIDLGGVTRLFTVEDSASAASDLTITGAITGTGGITKTGAGTLTLDGVSSYAGLTTVNAGTLKGVGTIAGPLTIGDANGLADAILAPGNSIGTLTAGGNLIFDADSQFQLEINSTTVSSDLLSSPTGTLTIVAGAELAVADLGAGVVAVGQSLPFIAYNGVLAGQFALGGTPLVDDTTEFTVGGNTFVVDYNLGGNQVALVAVPEPAGVALLAMAGLGLLGRRRRSCR